jgi:glycosyltransferase involved in cell wall biosynthesis
MTTEKPSSPLVSVVIPTRNRARTLKYCLGTIISQLYPSIQIVVSDNNSSDDTRDLIASLRESRITYVRSERSLSINDSYNFALDAARGEYVTFIGDDDGFLPDAIAFGMALLADNKYSAITWRKINYHWPDHKIQSERNILCGQSEPLLLEANGIRKLKLMAAFKEGYNNLPCIYNSIVDMKTIEKVRANSPDGLFFGGRIPDVHSGIALSPFVGTYLQALFPLTINGASSMSSGVIHGMKKRTSEEDALIKDIAPEALRGAYDPDIGLSPSIVSIVQGEYLLARSRLQSIKWPKPKWRCYIKALIREACHSPNQESILTSAKYTAKRRRIIIFIPKIKLPAKVLDGDKSSFHGRLVLPVDMVSNVQQAAKLLGNLLPKNPFVDRRVLLYFLRKWFHLNLRMAVDFYRAMRS